MKSLSEQMVSIDRENFSRIARGMPELPYAQDTPAEQTAEIFNALFSALRAAFPASVHSFSDQSEFDELRRQWALAFRENGITTMEQVNAGLRIARRQNVRSCRRQVSSSHGAGKVMAPSVSPLTMSCLNTGAGESWFFATRPVSNIRGASPCSITSALNCADAVLTTSSARKNLFALLVIYSTTGKCVFLMESLFHQYAGH